MTSDTSASDTVNVENSLDVDQNPKAEFLTLAGVAAAALASTQLGQQSYQLLKTTVPLIIQILDSVSDGSTHQIHVRLTNCTAHGIYVEEISCVDPKELNQTLYPNTRQLMSLGEPSIPTKPFSLPLLIPPGSKAEFKMHLWPVDPQRLERNPWGRSEIAFSRLDEKKISKVDFVFRLRAV